MKEHVSFIILNYCSTDLTVQCVESIEKNIEYDNYSIVIVDNGSTDKSGIILKDKFMNNFRIHILCLEKNIGFARGNNVGYSFAKRKLGASYMIITNSDTIFTQANYIDILQKEYKEKNYAIAGPDIITPSGIHQNPHREHALTLKELKKMLFIKSVFLYYFRAKKVMQLDNKIEILEKMYEKKDKHTQIHVDYRNEKNRVVLLGACLIFSPSFIINEEEAFCSKTFMYGEEDILTYLAEGKNYEIWYLPQIRVIHLNGEVTRKNYKNSLDKNIFTYTYIVEGCKILLQMMKNRGR